MVRSLNKIVREITGNRSPQVRTRSKMARPVKGFPQGLLILSFTMIVLLLLLWLIKNNNKTSVATQKTPIKTNVIVVKQDPPGNDNRIYVVKPGDRLIDIGYSFYSNKLDWTLIYAENKTNVINEDSITPGQRLIIPRK